MVERRARRRPGENRKRLLEAGLVEFGLFGYHGASTSGIAARAGVPQPHVYASFKTKQELFLDCLQHALSGPAVGGEPTAALILFQAVAVAGDPSLSEQLRPLLSSLREARGSDSFDDLLLLAARTLERPA